jgi:hypothetical protein
VDYEGSSVSEDHAVSIFRVEGGNKRLFSDVCVRMNGFASKDTVAFVIIKCMAFIAGVR